MEKLELSIKRPNLIKLAMCVGLIIILLLLPVFIESLYLIHIFIITLIYIIAASSLRFIAISGQLSLGHAAFMSIGAYTAGVFGKQLGWLPWITMPLGALGTMAVGILVGYPFTRLRALYFSMVSLFFGIGILAVNSAFVKFTGGTASITGIPSLFAGSKVPNYYFFLGLTVFSLLILHRFESCRIGATLKTIAQSHMIASSVGINESGYRVLALAIGCFFAGLAGAAYAHYNLVLSQSAFNLLASINILIYVLVGGTGSFAGPVIGTTILIIIPELFRVLKQFAPYLFVGILLIVIFAMPEGLAGLHKQIKSALAKRREDRCITHAS
jgi:branched-chain amino acid transport system permease protein